MPDFNLPHRRYNPLTKEWLLVSPHRTQRPWQGQQEKTASPSGVKYVPDCYLCPGNSRASGGKNPIYKETFVFQNDYSAVMPKSSGDTNRQENSGVDSLFRAEEVNGRCMVICYSPDHDVTLPQMSQSQIIKVIETWQSVYQSSLDDPDIKYCQIFENKGSVMGCSNPHPHGQAWMTNIVPNEPAKEHESFKEYFEKNKSGLLSDYIKAEIEKKDRIVAINDGFIALVPFWAIWPYEIMVLPRKQIARITELDSQGKKHLAEVLSQITIKYDNLFKTSFPYSMGIHQACSDQSAEDSIDHLHFHFYPPLLRSASVKKFLVGFEMLGMPQRDLTPEKAAATLRDLSGEKRFD